MRWLLMLCALAAAALAQAGALFAQDTLRLDQAVSGAAQGAYVLIDAPDGAPDVVLVASGHAGQGAWVGWRWTGWLVVVAAGMAWLAARGPSSGCSSVGGLAISPNSSDPGADVGCRAGSAGECT